MQIPEAYQWYRLAKMGVVAEKTLRWYDDRIKKLIDHLGDTELSEINLNDLRLWRSKLIESALSQSYVHGILRAAKTFLTWCVEEQLLESSPAARLELPKLPQKRPRGISKTARDLIIAEAHRGPVRDLAIVLMLADTACRVGGLANMRLCDLDLDTRRALVREKGRGGGMVRPVFFMRETAAVLAAWLVERGDILGIDNVFVGQRPGRPPAPLSENGIYQVIKRLAARAGVMGRGWNPHNWRHAAIRGMLDRQLPLPVVSQLAGHASVQVTGDIYGVYGETDLQNWHDKGSFYGD